MFSLCGSIFKSLAHCTGTATSLISVVVHWLDCPPLARCILHTGSSGLNSLLPHLCRLSQALLALVAGGENATLLGIEREVIGWRASRRVIEQFMMSGEGVKERLRLHPALRL